MRRGLRRLWLRIQLAWVAIATEQAERAEAVASARLEALARREIKLRTSLTAASPVAIPPLHPTTWRLS